MYCPKCGVEISDGVNFCPKCGYRVAGVQPYYPPPVVYPYNYGYVQPPKPPRPGRVMIMVVGIILTVFGAFSFLIDLGLLLNVPNAANYMPSGYTEILIYEFLMAAVSLAFGIAGIIFAPHKNKAAFVIGFGITLTVLRLVDIFWGIAVLGSYIPIATTVGSILGCSLPILYIVGGYMRKNAQY